MIHIKTFLKGVVDSAKTPFLKVRKMLHQKNEIKEQNCAIFEHQKALKISKAKPLDDLSKLIHCILNPQNEDEIICDDDDGARISPVHDILSNNIY